MHDFFSGIQQIGIGVKNASECMRYYAKLFGMDALVFDDTSHANLMKKYTGETVFKRRASLTINMQGGGGIELWQFLDRQSEEQPANIQYGDVGIYAAKIKCEDIATAYSAFIKKDNLLASDLQNNVDGEKYFWVKDAYNNLFNVIKGEYFYEQKNKLTGGITGAVIGVSDMDTSLRFYKTLLNIDAIKHDIITKEGFETSDQLYRKVILQKPQSCKGPFGKLLGAIEIELVQCLNRKPSVIFENRFWGDCGFIHLCLDVFNMDGLKAYMEKCGYAFAVDSINSFDMENASGRFCYVEDPDGTLIELVETHKIPVLKKLGIYLNLKKKGLEKPLPDWIIKMLALSKVK